MYPLPNLLVLADSCTPYEHSYCGVNVINPSSFSVDYSFMVVFPMKNEVEFSKMPEEILAYEPPKNNKKKVKVVKSVKKTLTSITNFFSAKQVNNSDFDMNLDDGEGADEVSDDGLDVEEFEYEPEASFIANEEDIYNHDVLQLQKNREQEELERFNNFEEFELIRDHNNEKILSSKENYSIENGDGDYLAEEEDYDEFGKLMQSTQYVDEGDD